MESLRTNSEKKLDGILGRCQGAYSEKTLSGYRNDLEHFQRWCATRDLAWVPAEATTIAAFIDEQTPTLAIATIKRRVEAIKFAHRMLDLLSPAEHSEVRLALRRASRAKLSRPRQSLGLTAQLLGTMLAACPDTLAGKRDAALISVGYDTLCRSSELAAMQVEHLAGDYATIFVPRAKSDPFGVGRLAYLSQPTQDRVRAWLLASGASQGPLFRGLHTRKVSEESLATSSIRRIIKAAAVRAQLVDQAQALSGHSMRIGAAQDMMIAGIDQIAIMQAGGWKNVNVLGRYVENAVTKTIHLRRWERLELLARP